MRSERFQLFCSYCDEETTHRVHYVGTRLADIRCLSCGRTIGISRPRLVNYYTGAVAERLVTKPFRLARELRTDRQRFLISLPSRVVTKPLRVFRELTGVIADTAAS